MKKKASSLAKKIQQKIENRKRSRGGFFRTILRMIIIICAALVITVIAVEATARIGNYIKLTQDRHQKTEQLWQEVTTLRGYLLESCQEENVIRDYLFLEQKNCGKYFPELLVAESDPGLFDEFLFAFDRFAVHPESNMELIDEIKSGTQIDSEKSITREEFVRLGTDEALIKYLAEYRMNIEPLGEGGDWRVVQKEDQTIIMDLFWNADEGRPAINFVQQQMLIPLLGIKQSARKIQDSQSAEGRQSLLEAMQNIKAENTPRKNLLLMGTHGGNVDTIMLVSIDNTRKRITMISLPRDLWVENQKINGIYARRGREYFTEKIEEVTGQNIHHYAEIDMYAFIDAIDAVGGIDYRFDTPLIDPSYRTVDEEGNEGTLFYPIGTAHLRGVEALRVARSRHTSSDFSRADRQQRLLEALHNKMKSRQSVRSLAGTSRILMQYLNTDLTPIEGATMYFQAKDYDLRIGNVMSTKNILQSQILDLGNGVKPYVLLPLEEDWNLLPKFVWQQLLKP